MGLFRLLFGGSDGGNSRTMKVLPGKPFEWNRGLCLKAEENAHLIFPGALCLNGEPFGSVIEMSDDKTRIAISTDAENKPQKIHVFLEAGQHLMLRRNSEAVVSADDTRERVFEILSVS